MTSHIQNLRTTLAHDFGIDEAEKQLVRANATGVPGAWYRTRVRIPLFAQLEQLARQQVGPDGRSVTVPGTLEWPPSDMAMRDQPILNANAYVVPTRLPEHPLRRLGFVPVAAVDDTDQFVAGWIQVSALERAEPPAYVDGMRTVAAPLPPAPSFRLPEGAFAPQAFGPRPVFTPSSPLPAWTRPGFLPQAPQPYAPPIQTELPAVPAPAPLAFTETPVGKVAVAGAIIATALAIASAVRGPAKPPKANRGSRGNGWHWVRSNVAVQYRGGKPVKMQGWGNIDAAVSAVERFCGCKLSLGRTAPGPATLSSRRSWSIPIRGV